MRHESRYALVLLATGIVILVAGLTWPANAGLVAPGHESLHGLPPLNQAVQPSFVPHVAGTSGWVEWGAPNSAYTALGGMESIWPVPGLPSSNGKPVQEVYLWDGISASPLVYPLLQPLLQYGTSLCGGGSNQYWFVSMLVTSSGSTICGRMLGVSPGDTLIGYVSGSSCSSSTGKCDWTIQSTDVSTGRSSLLYCQGSGGTQTNYLCNLALYAPQVVLEVYYLNSCSEYPASGSTTFRTTTIWNTNGNTLYTPWSGYVTWGFTPACSYNVQVSQPYSGLWSVQLNY